MKVAIIGYGVVGKGVDILLENSSIEVSKIFDRPSRLHENNRMCDNFQIILEDDSIDVIVETLGGLEPAHSFIIQAMKAGKSVVSANKAVIAHYFEEFHKIAEENDVYFMFEASVGGTIPILKTIYETRDVDSITKVGGILNGTSNYILSKMELESLSFEEALKQAQEAGYAEYDPTDDIEGIDIRNKIMIASSISFKTVAPLKEIPTMGISKITKKDMAQFKKFNLSCKLFAMAQRIQNTYSISVEPTLFSRNSIESSVISNFNLAMVETPSNGLVSIIGQGAGRLPTAHAMVTDLKYIEKKAPIREFTKDNDVVYCENTKECVYYIRTKLSRDDFPSSIQNSIIYQNAEMYFVEGITRKDLIEIQALDSSLFYARCDENVYEFIKKEVNA